jgi:hypothetical protein
VKRDQGKCNYKQKLTALEQMKVYMSKGGKQKKKKKSIKKKE